MNDATRQSAPYEKAAAALASDGDAQLRTLALQQFLQRGVPTTRLEDWKYTDLDTIFVHSNQWLATLSDVGEIDAALILSTKATLDAHWLVIANGRFQEDLSELPPNVTLSRDVEYDANDSIDALGDLNFALLQSGLSIHVGRDTHVEKPIALMFIDHSATSPQTTQSRVSIKTEPGSKASFVEYHVSTGNADHYANVQIDLSLHERAQVGYVRLQQRGLQHRQTARLNVRLHAHSLFEHFAVDLGAALARNDLNVSIEGESARAEFNGLYIAGDGQHVDNHTRVDHRVGPAVSVQEYRGILAGKSRGVWNGKAVVHAGADGTDAEQANHNLLLSEHCEIDAKPELEIYADEVKCAHGTTVGQLDEEALFYLRARGLDEQRARRILTRAFAMRVIDKAPVEGLQERIAALVETRLSSLDEGTL